MVFACLPDKKLSLWHRKGALKYILICAAIMRGELVMVAQYIVWPSWQKMLDEFCIWLCRQTFLFLNDNMVFFKVK